MQRRLSQGEIDQLVHLYGEGASIDGLARRRVVHTMTDGSVALAAVRYEQDAWSPAHSITTTQSGH